MMERLRALKELESEYNKDHKGEVEKKETEDDSESEQTQYESERDRKENYLFNHVLKKNN